MLPFHHLQRRVISRAAFMGLRPSETQITVSHTNLYGGADSSFSASSSGNRKQLSLDPPYPDRTSFNSKTAEISQDLLFNQTGQPQQQNDIRVPPENQGKLSAISPASCASRALGGQTDMGEPLCYSTPLIPANSAASCPSRAYGGKTDTGFRPPEFQKSTSYTISSGSLKPLINFLHLSDQKSSSSASSSGNTKQQFLPTTPYPERPFINSKKAECQNGSPLTSTNVTSSATLSGNLKRSTNPYYLPENFRRPTDSTNMKRPSSLISKDKNVSSSAISSGNIKHLPLFQNSPDRSQINFKMAEISQNFHLAANGFQKSTNNSGNFKSNSIQNLQFSHDQKWRTLQNSQCGRQMSGNSHCLRQATQRPAFFARQTGYQRLVYQRPIADQCSGHQPQFKNTPKVYKNLPISNLNTPNLIPLQQNSANFLQCRQNVNNPTNYSANDYSLSAHKMELNTPHSISPHQNSSQNLKRMAQTEASFCAQQTHTDKTVELPSLFQCLHCKGWWHHRFICPELIQADFDRFMGLHGHSYSQNSDLFLPGYPENTKNSKNRKKLNKFQNSTKFANFSTKQFINATKKPELKMPKCSLKLDSKHQSTANNPEKSNDSEDQTDFSKPTQAATSKNACLHGQDRINASNSISIDFTSVSSSTSPLAPLQQQQPPKTFEKQQQLLNTKSNNSAHDSKAPKSILKSECLTTSNKTRKSIHFSMPIESTQAVIPKNACDNDQDLKKVLLDSILVDSTKVPPSILPSALSQQQSLHQTQSGHEQLYLSSQQQLTKPFEKLQQLLNTKFNRFVTEPEIEILKTVLKSICSLTSKNAGSIFMKKFLKLNNSSTRFSLSNPTVSSFSENGYNYGQDRTNVLDPRSIDSISVPSSTSPLAPVQQQPLLQIEIGHEQLYSLKKKPQLLITKSNTTLIALSKNASIYGQDQIIVLLGSARPFPPISEGQLNSEKRSYIKRKTVWTHRSIIARPDEIDYSIDRSDLDCYPEPLLNNFYDEHSFAMNYGYHTPVPYIHMSFLHLNLSKDIHLKDGTILVMPLRSYEPDRVNRCNYFGWIGHRSNVCPRTPLFYHWPHLIQNEARHHPNVENFVKQKQNVVRDVENMDKPDENCERLDVLHESSKPICIGRQEELKKLDVIESVIETNYHQEFVNLANVESATISNEPIPSTIGPTVLMAPSVPNETASKVQFAADSEAADSSQSNEAKGLREARELTKAYFRQKLQSKSLKQFYRDYDESQSKSFYQPEQKSENQQSQMNSSFQKIESVSAGVGKTSLGEMSSEPPRPAFQRASDAMSSMGRSSGCREANISGTQRRKVETEARESEMIPIDVNSRYDGNFLGAQKDFVPATENQSTEKSYEQTQSTGTQSNPEFCQQEMSGYCDEFYPRYECSDPYAENDKGLLSMIKDCQQMNSKKRRKMVRKYLVELEKNPDYLEEILEGKRPLPVKKETNECNSSKWSRELEESVCESFCENLREVMKAANFSDIPIARMGRLDENNVGNRKEAHVQQQPKDKDYNNQSEKSDKESESSKYEPTLILPASDHLLDHIWIENICTVDCAGPLNSVSLDIVDQLFREHGQEYVQKLWMTDLPYRVVAGYSQMAIAMEGQLMLTVHLEGQTRKMPFWIETNRVKNINELQHGFCVIIGQPGMQQVGMEVKVTGRRDLMKRVEAIPINVHGLSLMTGRVKLLMKDYWNLEWIGPNPVRSEKTDYEMGLRLIEKCNRRERREIQESLEETLMLNEFEKPEMYTYNTELSVKFLTAVYENHGLKWTYEEYGHKLPCNLANRSWITVASKVVKDNPSTSKEQIADLLDSASENETESNNGTSTAMGKALLTFCAGKQVRSCESDGDLIPPVKALKHQPEKMVLLMDRRLSANRGALVANVNVIDRTEPCSEHVAEILRKQGFKIKTQRTKTSTNTKTLVRNEKPTINIDKIEDVQKTWDENDSAAEHLTWIRLSRMQSHSGTPTPGQTTNLREPIRMDSHTHTITLSRKKDLIFDVTSPLENVAETLLEIEKSNYSCTGSFQEQQQKQQYEKMVPETRLAPRLGPQQQHNVESAKRVCDESRIIVILESFDQYAQKKSPEEENAETAYFLVGGGDSVVNRVKHNNTANTSAEMFERLRQLSIKLHAVRMKTVADLVQFVQESSKYSVCQICSFTDDDKLYCCSQPLEYYKPECDTGCRIYYMDYESVVCPHKGRDLATTVVCPHKGRDLEELERCFQRMHKLFSVAGGNSQRSLPDKSPAMETVTWTEGSRPEVLEARQSVPDSQHVVMDTLNPSSAHSAHPSNTLGMMLTILELDPSRKYPQLNTTVLQTFLLLPQKYYGLMQTVKKESFNPRTPR